jgi:two-component system LytT family response regulator
MHTDIAPNTVRSIIVDDELFSRESLKKLLERHCPHIALCGEAGNTDDARKLIAAHQPGLVFLDIAMPGESGLEFLARMGEVDFEVIFATAHDEYVLQALRLSAVDYLQKPIDTTQLIHAVSNATQRLQAKNSQLLLKTLQHNLEPKTNEADMRLCIGTLRGFQVVDISSIIYCEADHNYTNFTCTGNTKIVASRPLADFEEVLAGSGFFRIHKSTLINLNQVKEYLRGDGGEVIMRDGTTLTVSRRRKDEFLEKIKSLFKS